MREATWLVVSLSLSVALGCGQSLDDDPGSSARSALGGESDLVSTFERVADTWDVPAEILATLAYTETRLRFVEPGVADFHSHSPGTVGMVGLSHADDARSIEIAASLAGVDLTDAEHDLSANLDAAAALLDHYRDQLGGARDWVDWYPVLAAYGGDVLAREVMRQLSLGWRGLDIEGKWLVCSARDAEVVTEPGVGTVRQGLGYPGAIWNPASSTNYNASNRGASSINYVIIHTTQGSYAGTISWFKNSSSNVSAHYVTRSSDGEVTHMVDDSDIAWHDACFNSETIGIEHEGFVADPGTWYTEAMYTESAKLTAWLCDQYGIPKDRSHIMGHGEAPDCSDHTDPGSGWDWTHYMALVSAGGMPTFGATYQAQSFPTEMTSGEEVVVWFDFVNNSNVTWGLNETRLGTAAPQDRESPFFVEGNWMSPSRATGADHSNYAPGTTGRFTFLIRAPEVTEPTEFTETYQLVQEGVSWFGPEVSATVRVVPEGWTEPDPEDPSDPGDPGDPGDPPVGPTDPGNPDASGGCAAGSGAPGGACVILLVGAFVAISRRRRHG